MATAVPVRVRPSAPYYDFLGVEENSIISVSRVSADTNPEIMENSQISNTLKHQFHEVLLDIYWRSKDEINCKPTQFLQIIESHRGNTHHLSRTNLTFFRL